MATCCDDTRDPPPPEPVITNYCCGLYPLIKKPLPTSGPPIFRRARLPSSLAAKLGYLARYWPAISDPRSIREASDSISIRFGVGIFFPQQSTVVVGVFYLFFFCVPNATPAVRQRFICLRCRWPTFSGAR